MPSAWTPVLPVHRGFGMKFDKTIYIPLTKYDPIQGIAIGVAASEAVDSDGERMHYDRSKPELEVWSANISKATHGKSVGNVREQHDPHTAAGLLTNMTFHDELKQVEVAARVVDPVAKEKLATGVYTGFSIGGKYKDRWVEGGYQWYVPAVAEISLVDNPSNPEAYFSVVKADGSTELRKCAGKGTEAPIPLGKANVDEKCGKCGKALVDGKCEGCSKAESPAEEAAEERIHPGIHDQVDAELAGKATSGTPANEDGVAKGVRYLVAPDHLPVSDESGKPSHRLMGAAYAALTVGYRGNVYEGPDKEKALAELKRLYESEGLELPSHEKCSAANELWKALDALEGDGDISGILGSLDELEKMVGGTEMADELSKAARKSIHDKIKSLRDHLDAHNAKCAGFHKAAHEHLDGIAKVIGGGPESTEHDAGFEPHSENVVAETPAGKVDKDEISKLVKDGVKESLKAIAKGIGDRSTAQPFVKAEAVTKAKDNGTEAPVPDELKKEDYVKAMASPGGTDAAKVLKAQESQWRNDYVPAAQRLSKKA